MIVGIIGLGYWGPNLVRNFLAQDKVSKVIACDTLSERLKFVKTKCPAAELTNSSEEQSDQIIISLENINNIDDRGEGTSQNPC